jgi:branched-chain amino acid transport system permease protein
MRARLRVLTPYVLLVLAEIIAYRSSATSSYWANVTLQWTLFATMAVAFNVISGFAGRLAFGNTIFFGVAAYIVVAGDVNRWYPPLAGLAIAVPACAVLAYGMSYAFRRLNGLMFALATFAVALILQQLVTISGVLGSAAGLQEPLSVNNSLLDLAFSQPVNYVIAGLVLLLLAVVVSHLIARSNWGLMLKAGRDDPVAATTSGVNVRRNMALAWAVSAAITALAGVFYAQFNLFVEPVSSFGLVTVNSIAIPAIIGGLGYVWGPVLGSAIVPLGLYMNNLSTGQGGISSPNDLLYGAVLIVVLRLWPGGLISVRDTAWVGRHLPWLARRKPQDTAHRPLAAQAAGVAPVPVVTAEDRVAPEADRPPRPLLQVTDVAKRFGGLQALQGVTLGVDAGEILGLVGPNGAGKSTLFDCITGVERPDSGRVLLNGQQISGLPAHTVAKRGITRTYQTPRLFDRLSAMENVECAAVARASGDGTARAEAALAAVGLARHAHVPAAKLTLIERRMVELARALVTEPGIVLLDEVMTGLEESEAARIQELIRQLHGRGISFVIVEHVMGYLLPLTHRVAVLHQGAILASGPPREVLRHPEVLEAYFGHVDAHTEPSDQPVMAEARPEHADQ